MDTTQDKKPYQISIESNLISFKAGEIILSEGEESDHACKMVMGTAKVIRSGDVVATSVVEIISNRVFQQMLKEDQELLDHIC